MTSTSDGPDARTALGRSPLGEERIKHLEFIQAVINRMATNSFFVKGWVLTLAAGLLTVSASRLSWQIAVVGLVPLLCFWSLDGYFLQQERLFRHLYDDVRHVDSEPLADQTSPDRAPDPDDEFTHVPVSPSRAEAERACIAGSPHGWQGGEAPTGVRAVGAEHLRVAVDQRRRGELGAAHRVPWATRWAADAPRMAWFSRSPSLPCCRGAAGRGRRASRLPGWPSGRCPGSRPAVLPIRPVPTCVR